MLQSMIFQLWILVLLQVTLVLHAVTPGTEKVEPKCWGPGVWPHPHFCRLFSVCTVDTRNMVSGQLFMCPPGTGYSMGRSGCFPKELVTNCFHNKKNSDGVLESSSVEHLMLAGETSRFHCAGHTVPYCDGSEMLVVCGPNQGLLGAVNCSSYSSEQRHCDMKINKCVLTHLPPQGILEEKSLRMDTGGRRELSIRRPDLMTAQTTPHSSIVRTTKKQETFDRYGESYSFSKSVIQDDDPDENSYIPSHAELEELSATCIRPGKQCTSRNHTLLIACSDDLKVVHVWDCYTFFPFLFFQAELGVKVSCDSLHDSCAIRVENMLDKKFGEEIHKINQQHMKEKAWKSNRVSVKDLTTFTCQHPGLQCIPSNNAIIVECSKDLKVIQVQDCASVFPADPLSQLTNTYYQCDSQSNRCAIKIELGLQEPSLGGVPLSFNSPSPNNPKHSLLKGAGLSTRSPQDDLAKKVNEIQESLKNLENYLPETEQDSAPLYKIGEGSLKTTENTPLVQSNSVKGLGDISPSLQEILSNSVIPSFNSLHDSKHENEAYICRHAGFQCTTKNISLLLECSDDLQLLNVKTCLSLIPFADKNKMNAVCDPQRDDCVVFLDEQQALIDGNKFYNKKTLADNNIAENQCVKEGRHCSTKSTSTVLECSESLKLLNVWDCSSLLPVELPQNVNVICDQFYDSCVLYRGSDSTYSKKLDTNKSVTEKNLVTNMSEQLQLCRKSGKQCTEFNTSILIECSENLKVVNMSDCASLFPQGAVKEKSEVRCSLDDDDCVIFYPGQSPISLKAVLNTTVPVPNRTSPHPYVVTTSETSDDDSSYYDENHSTQSVPIGPENIELQNCQKEGLQCANNATIMDCPFDLSEPNFVMSCSDMIQITHNEKAYGYCDHQQASCLLKVNEETLKLRLSQFDIGEHSVFPDFTSKCQQGGLHCADHVTLVMCSGEDDNIDYAITCGYSSGDIQAYCDPQTESCFMDTETVTSKSVPVSQLTTSEDDNNRMITPEKILDMNSVPGMFVNALKELSAHFESSTSLSSSSVYSSTTPVPIGIGTSYKKVKVNSQDSSSQLKHQSPAKSLNEAQICHSPGWRCLNQDILILCSEELLLQGFLPCAETHIHGYCDNSTSQCVRKESSFLSSSTCTKPGLQCLDDSTIGICSFDLKIEYSLPCADVHPESSCDKHLVACISPSLHVTYTPT